MQDFKGNSPIQDTRQQRDYRKVALCLSFNLQVDAVSYFVCEHGYKSPHCCVSSVGGTCSVD